MTSPLTRAKAAQQVSVETKTMLNQMYDQVATQPPEYIPASRSPLAKVQSTTYIPATTVVSDDDIEKLGANLGRNIGQTTEKIVKKMGVASFEELGTILVDVRNQAAKLDPNSIQKRGVLGWWQRVFGNVKRELTTRLSNAEAVFKELEAKLSKHIEVHVEWIKDLEALKNENFDRYNEIQVVLKKFEEWQVLVDNQIKNWEVIEPTDPDAAMKAQALQDAMARLNRIGIKIDNFRRWKALTESNVPKLNSQQNTSRTTIMTLKDVIEQTIPMIKMEFTMFLQSLDSKKSIELVNSARTLANTTLVKSADTAKQVAIDSATNLNTPLIATESLNHIQTAMLETIKSVDQINRSAQATRLQDKTAIEESQKLYLKALQDAKAL